MSRTILIKKDPDELSQAAAALFARLASESIAKHDSFLVSLAGGSTPRKCYEKLASDYRTAVDWEKVLFFFGDERNVPADSDESNYRMANETLLSPLNIIPGRVFRWKTELKPVAAAADVYGIDLANNIATSGRAFDVVMLGLGTDGHTASLFPHSPALIEPKKRAVANWIEKLKTFRFTITFPVINDASNIIFLASGKEKAQAVREVLEGEFDPENYPAQYVKPANGNVYWFIDEAASSMLESR